MNLSQNLYPLINNEVSLPNNIPAHIQTNSSNSGSNNTMSMQTFYGGNNMNLGNECDCFYNSTTNQYQSFCGMSLVPPGFKYYGQHCPSDTINTTVSASSSSPVAPIQNLMNNWYAWGVQPTNVAGNEPTNTKAALNTMTNQWQFFPSQNAGNSVSANKTSTNTASTANPTSQAQTALSNATSTTSANASPQASNGLSEVAQEFEKAINSIFGSISNFVKNL